MASDITRKIASERVEYALYKEWKTDARVLTDAVESADTTRLAMLAKFVPYRALIKAGAQARLPPVALAAAAYRDTERMRAKSLPLRMPDGSTPAADWQARGGMALCKNVPHESVAHNCYMCHVNYPWSCSLGSWKPEDGGHANLCWHCGVTNMLRGEETADLSGWTVVITGCRHTVGYAAALQLLRMGAAVIGTTRYPGAALLNFAAEPDYTVWHARLTLLRVDFLQPAQLKCLVAYLTSHVPDAFISNAFLTVQQTDAYYAITEQVDERMCVSDAATLEDDSQVIRDGKGALDHHTTTLAANATTDAVAGAGADMGTSIVRADSAAPSRATAIRAWLATSGHAINEHGNLDEPPRATLWTQTLADMDSTVMYETTLINQIVPTMLLQHVCALMKATPTSNRVLINVTSTEHRHYTDRHVVTGMHKAAMETLFRKLALNKTDGLTVCSVDPGFVTGVIGSRRKPLTRHDGGARVVHPLVRLANGKPLTRNVFVWKDYKPYAAM